ncbi:MAG: aminotransferase class I/II-fold pyridoxal phosphate-dependent enzyme [Fimbriimonadaceae bacterium]|nr:aminotransferase class I/II-fold pyridoxal phosphate-dependent enzyme [Fimbriimonadaceae bacterium]
MSDVTVPTRRRVARLVEDLPPSGIRRFFDLVQGTPGVISLGVGEPDFATPWVISTRSIAGLEAGRTTYTSNLGLPELRQAIADNLERRYQVRYDWASEILVTVGVSEALDLAFRAILEPGDEVLIPEPCFVSYGPTVTLAHGQPVPVPTYVEDEFVPRVELLEAAITPRTRAILIGSPSNPTGAVYPLQTMRDIADLAAAHDLILLSDEIYDRLLYDGTAHVCAAALPGARERLILFNGFSKAYAMTGWRVGYACAPGDILAGMVKIHQYALMCASIMGQEAAIEALRRGERAVEEMVKSYDQRRRLLVAGFNSAGLPCFLPRGAFYTFPDIRATGLDSETFCQRLLTEEKLAVVPGNAFGACGEGHLRATYAASLDDLREAITRLTRFVARL